MSDRTPDVPGLSTDTSSEAVPERRSTLAGWEPHVGDLVWQQMYCPQHPAHDSTIAERVAAGKTYDRRRLMRLHDIDPDYLGQQGLTRWFLMDPWRPTRTGYPIDRERPSWVESDWCVLESVSLAEAVEAERNARPGGPDMLPMFDTEAP